MAVCVCAKTTSVTRMPYNRCSLRAARTLCDCVAYISFSLCHCFYLNSFVQTNKKPDEKCVKVFPSISLPFISIWHGCLICFTVWVQSNLGKKSALLVTRPQGISDSKAFHLFHFDRSVWQSYICETRQSAGYYLVLCRVAITAWLKCNITFTELINWHQKATINWIEMSHPRNDTSL